MKYLLLPVHVSLSFVKPPTVVASLYLLLLLLQHRRYSEAFKLVPLIGTDTALLPDEKLVMSSVVNVAEPHPDARAVYLALTLAVLEAPVAVREVVNAWDLPNGCAAYLESLAYVGQSCRLDRESELLVVGQAADQLKKEKAIRKVVDQAVAETAKSAYEATIATQLAYQYPQQVSRLDIILAHILVLTLTLARPLTCGPSDHCQWARSQPRNVFSVSSIISAKRRKGRLYSRIRMVPTGQYTDRIDQSNSLLG